MSHLQLSVHSTACRQILNGIYEANLLSGAVNRKLPSNIAMSSTTAFQRLTSSGSMLEADPDLNKATRRLPESWSYRDGMISESTLCSLFVRGLVTSTTVVGL